MAVLFVLHSEADSSSAEIDECGRCGPNVYYYIYSNGTLEIFGAGTMYDYGDSKLPPWYEHREDIKKIVIGEDIDYLGKWSFLNCTNVRELIIPITLNSVVSDTTPVFAGCNSIEKINFTPGWDGYGYNYAAYPGSNAWFLNTPWYQSKDCLKEINFADGITHIGSDAFRELNITKVVLPDSVVALECHSFFYCIKLTDLTLPISLNTIVNDDYPAFQGSIWIEKITFTRGNGVPFDYGDENDILAPWNMNRFVSRTIVISDDITRLGERMFYEYVGGDLYGCTIRNLTLPISCIDTDRDSPFPENVYHTLQNLTITKGTGVGPDYSEKYAVNHLIWNYSPYLKSVIVQEGVTHIGKYTFYGCTADTLILPDSLCALSEYTFAHSTIKNLTIPISLNAVWLDGNDAFNCVSGLEKVTFTPGTGYGQDYSAYDGNNCCYKHTPWYVCRGSLKEIVFEDGIKHIGSDAFRELNITSIVIPNSVESLGCHTFYNCSELTELTIPISLDSICSERYPAFRGCNGITTLRFTAGTDGIGFDYENYAPSWCTPSHQPDVISFDSGITYIGTKTLALFSFVGSDGEVLQPTAECLSGHVFTKIANGTYSIDHASVATDDQVSVDCADIGRQ